jgi:hypothetical protein
MKFFTNFCFIRTQDHENYNQILVKLIQILS